MFYQSKRYCPVLVVQQVDGLCISPNGGALLHDQNRTITFGLIAFLTATIKFHYISAMSFTVHSVFFQAWNGIQSRIHFKVCFALEFSCFCALCFHLTLMRLLKARPTTLVASTPFFYDYTTALQQGIVPPG